MASKKAKRATAGERIAMSIDPEGTLGAALWRQRIARRIDAAIRRAVKARDRDWNARIHRFINDTRANLSGSRNAEYVDQWYQCLCSLDRFRRRWEHGEPDPARLTHTTDFLAAVGRECETRTVEDTSRFLSTITPASHQTGKVKARTNMKGAKRG